MEMRGDTERARRAAAAAEALYRQAPVAEGEQAPEKDAKKARKPPAKKSATKPRSGKG
jgi:hypothetical protein